MKVAATLVDRIVNAAVTEDGAHMALSVRSVDGQEFTLGIPIRLVSPLIERAVGVLAQSSRQSHHEIAFPPPWRPC